MGHYSDYYEGERIAANKVHLETYKIALQDLQEFRQYNHIGKLKPWTFRDVNLEKEFEALIVKLKAQIYDLLPEKE